jgi:hypothetical protein
MDKNMNFKKTSVLFAVTCGLIFASKSFAETQKVDFPAASPACTIKQRVGLTDVEVDYSRPGVKGRQIFGGLIPFGQVWRTGANQATKIIFSTPVKLNGNDIPAGTYGLFTIPGKDEWTIIISKGAEQWGAYKYSDKDDLARFKVTPVALDHPIDTFTIEFNKIKDDGSSLNLLWDKTEVPIKLEVDVTKKLVSEIEAVMSSDEKKKPYFQSAQFYYNHGLDLQKASKWIDQAVAERDAHYIVFVKAQILAKMGDKAGAIAAAKHASELAAKADDSGYVKMSDDLISSLK